MAVFTTNWYLYKTHFKATCGNSQIRNSRTAKSLWNEKAYRTPNIE